MGTVTLTLTASPRSSLALKLLWSVGRRRHARLSTPALGSITRGVA